MQSGSIKRYFGYAILAALLPLLLSCEAEIINGPVADEVSSEDPLSSNGSAPKPILYDKQPSIPQAGLQNFSAQGKWQKTDLRYFIYNYAQGVNTSAQQAAVAAAFKLWADVSALSFTEVGSVVEADMLIGFGSGSHCNLYEVRGLNCLGDPFDGAGGILAHAYFPGPSQYAGESHFDSQEPWIDRKASGAGVSLLSVAAHEIGHALGLAHSGDVNALMYASYDASSPKETLGSDDIAGIRSIYGSGGGGNTPAPVPPESIPPTQFPDIPRCGRPQVNDADGDSLDDYTEYYQLGTNPYACDTDRDGLSDAEVFVGLNPLLPDTDFDGVSDGQEIAQGTNPLIPDQGPGTGIIAGSYFGNDSVGSRLSIVLSADGTAEGVLSFNDPFQGAVNVPLIGSVDRAGELRLVSYDYFFNLIGVFSGQRIQGQLTTSGGAYTTWGVELANSFGLSVADLENRKISSSNNDASWQVYQPVIGKKNRGRRR